MTRRIGGVMDYSNLVRPAETSVDTAQQARRMQSAGHGLHDIASALGVHPEQVRRWLAIVDHDEAATAHARAWRGVP